MFLLQCYWEMWVIFRHLEHSQKSHTKIKGSQRFCSWFSCTFCPDFVDLYTSQCLKRCTDHDWGCKTSSYQMKAACECSAFSSRTLPPIPDSPTPPYIRYLACEQALLFGQAKRASRERAREGPRGLAARSRVFARLASLAQIGELARRLSAILLTYEISKVVIYMSLSIP